MSTAILDTVTQQFLAALQNDSHLIQNAAVRLFYYLVTLQLTLTALWQVLAGESLQRLLADMVKLAFLMGFFYGLIYLGSDWVPAIINGFIDVGQQASVKSLSPSSVVSQGVSIAGGILNGFFDITLFKHPFVSIVGTVVCLSICIIYALIAAELAIVLVKSYVLVAVSGLFFAFGGFELTRPMTKNYVQAIIGIGLHVMVLYFLLSVGQHMGSDWAVITKDAADNHQLMPMLVMLIAVIVYYMILKNVPSFIAGLSGVGGFRNYGAAAVGMSVNAAMQANRMLTRASKPTAAVGQFGGMAPWKLGKVSGQGIWNLSKKALQSGAATSTTAEDSTTMTFPAKAANHSRHIRAKNDATFTKPTTPPEKPDPNNKQA